MRRITRKVLYLFYQIIPKHLPRSEWSKLSRKVREYTGGGGISCRQERISILTKGQRSGWSAA